MMQKILLYVFCYMILLSGFPAFAESSEIEDPAHFPSLISSIQINPLLDFCGETVPLDNPDVYERLEKELLVLIWDRAQIILWLKRTGRYFPYIEEMLRKNRMPDDLKYVAVIESSLLPHIGSSKHAIGFWQFIRPTGARYGMRIDSDIDERRNLATSTEAAIKYFKKLYDDFGSWTLAVAAYNMGEAGLKSNIEFQKTNDFYNLYLPMETQRHILKIVAAKMILSNPEKYGFRMTKADLYKPIPVDHVRVESPSEIPIQLVAEAAGTYFKTIKDLNPELRGKYLSKGTYSIAIPKGSAKGFQARYETLIKEIVAKAEQEKKKKTPKRFVYVVRKGDFLSRIASRFNVSVSEIARWNRLNPRKPIRPGMRLVIYRD